MLQLSPDLRFIKENCHIFLNESFAQRYALNKPFVQRFALWRVPGWFLGVSRDAKEVD